MAARSSKGRTGRGGRSSGTSTRSRGAAAHSSRASGATRAASKSRGRGGTQARAKAAGSARSRSVSAEAESPRKRKPASRSRTEQPARKRTPVRRSAQEAPRSGGQPRRRTTSRSTAARAGRTSRAPRASRRSQADPIAILTQDHRNVAQLFEQYEVAKDGKKKRAVFDKIRSELELHTQLEEEIFYPEAESRQELKKELKEAHGEHDKVKQMLREAEGLDPESGEFDGTVAGIQGAVEHHVQEEEQQVFPVIQQSFSADHMKELAQRMQQRRAELQRGNATAGKARSLVGRLMGR